MRSFEIRVSNILKIIEVLESTANKISLILFLKDFNSILLKASKVVR